MKSRFLGILSLLLLTLALTACNGSSGSDSSSSSSGSASGIVAAAPLVGAQVFYENPDPSGEDFQIGETLANGVINFSPYKENLSKIDFSKPAIIYSEGGRNFVKEDDAVPFAGKLKGVMTSANSEVYLTPANTLVAALVKEGKSLNDAKTRVKKIVQIEMGLGEGIDPFAKPLSSSPELLVQSETASQAILAIVGLSEGAAGDFDSCMETIAINMTNGKSFAYAAGQLESSPVHGKTDKLFEIVKDLKETVIMPAVSATLKAVDSKKDIIDTTAITTAIEDTDNKIVNVEKKIIPSSITVDNPLDAKCSVKEILGKTYTFKATVLGSDENPITAANISYNDNDAPGTLTFDGNNTFTYNLKPEDFEAANLPFDLEIVVWSTVDPSITNTIKTTIVGDDSIVVKKMFINQGDHLFTVSTPVDKKITCPIGAEGFLATVNLVNDKADISGLVEMQFFAPKGSKFNNYLEGNGNTDNCLIIRDFTKDGIGDAAMHDAAIESGVNLIVELDEDIFVSKETEMTVKAFDVETGNELGSLTKDVAFILADDRTNVTDVVLGNSNINGEMRNVLSFKKENLDGEEFFTPKEGGTLKLKGSIKTWNSKYEPVNEVLDKRKLYEQGKFVLINTSNALTFRHADGLYYQNVDLAENTIEITDATAHTVEIDIKSVLEYKPAQNVGSDTLKLVYKPTGKESVPTSGGLRLDFDISE